MDTTIVQFTEWFVIVWLRRKVETIENNCFIKEIGKTMGNADNIPIVQKK